MTQRKPPPSWCGPVKAPFPYFGGKNLIARWIASQLPPHTVYVEPFAGSAAVLFAKRVSSHEVLNDVNGNIVCFFRVLRDRPAELVRACSLSPYARDEFAVCDVNDQSIDELERARRWWVTVNQGFNKTARPGNGWSASVACGAGEAKSVVNRVDRMMAAAQRLAGVIIENRDALETIDAYGCEPDAVLYLDPPYVRASRADHGAQYAHEFDTDDEHRALAARLLASPSAVILSGYHSDLYDELYGDWFTTSRTSTRRSGNRSSAEHPESTEVLWSNRPLITEQRLALG